LVVYAENATAEAAADKPHAQFAMSVPKGLRFVSVGPAAFLKPGRFKHFTLILQALCSVVYAFKCLLRAVSSVVIDTTGAPFAAPVWKLLGGCSVVFYVHCPFISSDMLSNVCEQRAATNKAADVARSWPRTRLKIVYFWLLHRLHGGDGRLRRRGARQLDVYGWARRGRVRAGAGHGVPAVRRPHARRAQAGAHRERRPVPAG